MNRLTALKTLRNLKQKEIPIVLGINTFLLSPRMLTSNNKGWKIRIVKRYLINYLNQIEIIIKEMDLSFELSSHNNEQYIEIFKLNKNLISNVESENIILIPV
ncbi:MAG: hypothetical protein NTV61_08015 [Candidatus Bathyarchaeota archaeon]|nr:hypothetical protein [Candidatus Bathyarchaeota archaeon]